MKVNSEDFNLNDLSTGTVSGLIGHFKLNPEHVAVDLNGIIIKPDSYDSIKLEKNDIVELIHFVGGG
jgi:sulfur carrier protein